MRHLFILILFFVGVIQMQAQNETLILSNVHDAINYVLNENPDLETYKLKQSKADQEYKNQKLSILPNVSGNFGGTHSFDLQTNALPGEIFDKPGETVNIPIGAPFSYNSGLTLKGDIIDVQYFFKRKISKINSEIESLQTEAFKQKLIEQTTLYYSAILITKQSITNHKKSLVMADSILSITQDRLSQGITDLSSVNLSKISFNNIKQTIINNEMALEQYNTELKKLIGLHTEDTLQIDEVFEANSIMLSNLNELNSDKNLEIYALQLLQSETDIKTKRAAFYPKLSVNAYYGYLQLMDDYGISFYNDAWNPYNYIGLNLSIPILSGYSNRGNLEVAKVNNSINEQVLEVEKQKSKLNDAQLITDYESSFEQLKISKQNHELFKQNADFSYNKYKEGIIGIDSYYKSFEDYLKAENSYLNSLSLVYTYYSRILSRQQ